MITCIDTAESWTDNGAPQGASHFVVPTVGCRRKERFVIVKTTWALACVLSVGIVFPVAAQNHSLVRFDGGIGVIPVSNGTVTNGVATRNVVRLVNPPGQIWVIKGLKANVSTETLSTHSPSRTSTMSPRGSSD